MAGFFSRLFGTSREPKYLERSTPKFVEAEIEKQTAIVKAQLEKAQLVAQTRRDVMEAFFPMSGYWGGSYLSDGQKFNSGIIFRGSSPIIDHSMTLRNARDAFHNSTMARSIINRKTEAVVGSGIRLEPKPNAMILGITQEEAEVKAREIKERFELWASSKYCSLDETMTLYQRQRLAQTCAGRDGEYFVRFHYLDDRGRPNPLALSSIEPTQIVGYPYTDTGNLPWAQDGIVRDERGREVAYKVRIKNDKGDYETKTIQAFDGNRRMMIHGFVPEYPGQVRGYSPLHHAIQEFSQATGFTVSTIQKALIQASIIMANETDAGSQPMMNPFSLSGAGPLGTVAQEATATTSTTVGEIPPYSPADVALSPGGIGIFQVPPGSKLKSFADTSPSAQFGPFMEAFFAIISASCSVPYELVIQRCSSNYSASRAAFVMFYGYAKIERGEQRSDFLDYVYEAWFAEEIAAGRLSAKGWLDPVMRLAWLNADWVGPLMPDIDPERSVNASRDAIEAGLTNVALEAQNHNGSDASMNRAINERVYGSDKVPWSKNSDTSTSTPKEIAKETTKAMEG